MHLRSLSLSLSLSLSQPSTNSTKLPPLSFRTTIQTIYQSQIKNQPQQNQINNQPPINPNQSLNPHETTTTDLPTHKSIINLPL